jgi:biopolymer transport protein ExbD
MRLPTACLPIGILVIATVQAQVSPGIQIRVTKTKTCYIANGYIANVGVPCKVIGAKLHDMKIDPTYHVIVVGDPHVGSDAISEVTEFLHQAGYPIVAGIVEN